MKRIFYIICLFSIMASCSNQDIEFEDYPYQGVFFPYQTPVRTLVLGDEVIGDNSIDLEHAFSIGASIGGMYNNSKDRIISIELAPELANKISAVTSDDTVALEILPANYYSAQLDKLIIPAGSFMGKVRIDLTDDFFQDPLTTGLHYVLPLIMTDADGDTILSGASKMSVIEPDVRVSSDWNIVPKNYTLFGIKYINPTHGTYLLRGKRVNIDDPEDFYIYSKRFLIDNDIIKLTTKSLTDNVMSNVGGSNKDGKYQMKLTFDEANNKVTVSQLDASTVVASGAGSFYLKNHEKAEGYNEKTHRTIYLDYTYEDEGVTYQVNDSLVFVDTDVKFEEYVVNVTEGEL